MRWFIIKKNIYIIVTVSFFILSGIIYYLASDSRGSSSTNEKFTLTDTSINPSEENMREEDGGTYALESLELPVFLVHVCGAVAVPGVYSFHEGARIIDGIEAAGGFLDTAAKGYLNLSMKMADEQRIYVPTEKEAEEAVPPLSNGAVSSPETDGQGRININTATAAKLMELPGIGIKKAEGIVKYREENGLFKSTKELMKVDGISSTLYKKIEDSVTI